MHGITQVKSVTGSKILRILKGQGLAPDIPEDLYYLIKKAVSMRKHLEGNRKDKDGKFRLILVESRIHRLARYYKVGPLVPCSACVPLVGGTAHVWKSEGGIGGSGKERTRGRGRFWVGFSVVEGLKVGEENVSFFHQHCFTACLLVFAILPAPD